MPSIVSVFFRIPIGISLVVFHHSGLDTNFKLLSWNIDGLDEHSIEIRTQGVIDVIKR
jgi:hypothetical protein